MSRTVDGECPICERIIELELWSHGICECGNECWVEEDDFISEDGQDYYSSIYIDWDKREKS